MFSFFFLYIYKFVFIVYMWMCIIFLSNLSFFKSIFMAMYVQSCTAVRVNQQLMHVDQIYR